MEVKEDGLQVEVHVVTKAGYRQMDTWLGCMGAIGTLGITRGTGKHLIRTQRGIPCRQLHYWNHRNSFVLSSVSCDSWLIGSYL